MTSGIERLLVWVTGLGLASAVVMITGVYLAPDWSFGAAALLLIPVVLSPLWPVVTGRSRLGMATHHGFSSALSLRLMLAFLPEGVLLGAGILLVVALAGPGETEQRVERTQDGLDILLAIDTSGSMSARDLDGRSGRLSRLAVAKGVVAEFIDQRPNDRIGVVVFGEEAFTHVPLTLDHDTLKDVLEHVQIGSAGPRGTAIGTALAVSSKRLLQIDNPERIVVLLTDGQSNAGEYSPLEAAQLARDLGVRVYTIGVGASRSALGQLFGSSGDGLDERTLTAIAETTGGAYFRATSVQGLRRVYETIDELERSPAEVRTAVERIEWYRFVAVPGLLLMALGILLQATVFRRWP